jgi:hypothetical protein
MSMSSTPSFHGDPQTVYSQWALYLDAQASGERRRERQVSHTRLFVFAVCLAAGWLAFGSHQIPASWTLPPAALFLVLVLLHDRLIRQLRVIDRSIDFFARGLARLDGTWPGQGRSGSSYLDPAHPYANDLDILGEGSLFELLGTVRTSAGEDLLARWLLHPVSAGVARQRQAAVRELIPRVELRRDLALLGEDVGNRVGSERLIEWGNAPASLRFAGLKWAAAALTALTLGSLAAWIWSGAGAIPFIVAISIQSAFALALRPWVTATLAAAEAPSHDLAVLSGLLARIEEEPVEAGRLVELSQTLDGQSMPPSKRIARLGRLMQFLDARRNQFFAPIGGLLLWGTQMAFALERWRADCGPTLGPWIDASAEIEVLCALSGYAYEQPRNIFPELVEDGPILEAEALGHPLIPASECVCNDLTLSDNCRALVMSGSNMSGKSTLLRTVGCAVVLALAGAPVRARRLRLSPLRIGASIRISDSLREGTSHFLAEIKRLRQIVDLTEGDVPALFLLDEILHGTNSHDRKIGADAVLRGLLKRGAIGIVTTHDLALARIAEHKELAVENVHFQDRIENGRMFFDFRLREGVVTRSNAIELMRSVGLDI